MVGRLALILALAAGMLPASFASGMQRPGPSSLDVLLAADKPVHAAGEPITLVLRVVNRGRAPLTLTFRSAQRFDVVVRDAGDREVWRWAAGRMFAQALGQEMIPPAGELAYTATLEKGLPPGAYTATGLLTTLEGGLSARLLLRVEPR